MTVTLEAIEKRQDELSQMIEKFKNQGSLFVIPSASINLRHGEHYAGIILNDEGDPDYHLILLPGEAESIKWNDAKQWAADRDGELPTRREQSLLFANLKGEFKETSYWSGQRHEDERYAWSQTFILGFQSCYYTGLKLLVLDRFDVLDLRGRGQLILWLNSLAITGEIESALIFGTMKALPGGIPDSIEAFWIDQGVVGKQREAA